MLTYAELFAGAGGMSMGLEAGGFAPFAHAEIEPHARAVLRKHWPDTRLDGDVTKINGADYRGITLLSGGSPCQDLSVAGKRAGIIDGTRSSLFFEQVRIWQESEAPYFLWENVGGALSSNSGRDFAAVLSALVGSPVTVPADGWRGGGGVVAGRAAVAAWRVLDLQHFGPPQRRVRVFVLAARASGVDPAEVLALAEGVCGHPSPRQQAREGITGRFAGGPAISINNESRGEAVEGGVAPLRAGHRHQAAVIAIGEATARQGAAHGSSAMIGRPGDPMFTLTSKQHGVFAFHHTQDPISGAVSPAIGGTTEGMGVVQPLVVGGRDKGAGDSYDNTPIVVAMRGREGGNMPEVSAEGPALRTPGGGSSQTFVVCTTGLVTHALTHEGADAREDGTGRGTPIVVPTLSMGSHTAAPGSNGQDELQFAAITTAHTGRPRRLTPKECERLMGWPDDHTRYGVKDDGTTYELSDTARYRLCGNGVGSACAAWIAKRLAASVGVSC